MSEKTIWNQLLDHDVLVECNPDSANRRFAGAKQYTVDAVSPSGLRVKFITSSGSFFWAKHDDYVLVEDLGIQ